MSLRSSTPVIQPLSSDRLESLNTVRRSACLVSSIWFAMAIGTAVTSVGNTTAARNDRSLPSATPPSMISGPAIADTTWSRTGS